MKDKFQSMVAYAPIAEPCAAKTPQNTGGGNSQCSVLQYESALLIPTVNRRSTDGQSQSNYPLNTLKKAWKYVACMLMVLFMGVGNVWAEKVTWTPTQNDVSSLTSNTKSLVVGTGTKTFTVYAIRSGNTPAVGWNNSAFRFNDKDFYKSGISIYIPNTSNDVTSVTFYLKNSNSKVIYYKALNSQTISENPSDLSSVNLTNAYVSYTPFSSISKGVYYAIGGKAASSGGDTYLEKVEVVFADGDVTPVCPTTVTISGTKSYTEGQKITLNAATNGNGTLTYQWYKGGTEDANKLTGKTAAKLEIEGCTTANAGNYYCFVGKTACDGAFNAEAYAVEVIEAPVSGDASDLVTISSAYTFTPTEALAHGKLYYGKKLYSAGGSDLSYGSNELTVSSSRKLAFKVAANAYVKVTFEPKSSRDFKIGTTDGGSELASSKTSPVSAICEAGGVVYLSASGDLKMSKLEISYPTLYTVTYDLNGGIVKSGETAPSEGKKIEGDQFTVAGNAAINAPEGKEFGGWNDGTSDYAAGDTYTVGTANVVLKAIWNTPKTPLTISWTTAPADGNAGTDADVTLAVNKGASTGAVTFSSSNESVAKIVDGNKLHYVGAGTATITANVATDATYEAASIEKEIKVTAYCGAAYAEWTLPINATTFTSFSKADKGITATADPVQSNMIISKATANSTMTVGIASTNAEGYIAFTFTVPEGKEFVPCNVLLNVQPIAANCDFTLVVEDNQGSEALSIDKADMASGQLKPIELTNAGSKAFSGTVSIKLYSTATTGNGYRLGKNVTIAGTLNNVTKYAVSFANGGADGSEAMDAVEYKAGATVVAPECGFTYTGHIFNGWTVTNVVGVTSVAAGGSFTMPGNPVTLTATWLANNYDAKIVETNTAYATLAEAIAAAAAGQTIQLLQDIEQEDGVLIDKDLVLDLNDKTYTCTAGANVNNRAIKITAGNVTITNGTITAVPTANFNGGCYGGLRIEGESANVTCTNVTFNNGRQYGLGIKLVTGQLRMEGCTVNSANGGGGLEVAGTADVINCTFTQTGLDPQAWISTCLAVCHGGELNVQGGTYTSENYSLYVYSSGGEMDVENGSFTGNIVNTIDHNTYPDATGTINISGGTFEGVGDAPIAFTVGANYTDINISGGTFDAPVENKYCAENYAPKDNGDGTYGVKPLATSIDFVAIIDAKGTGDAAKAELDAQLAAKHYDIDGTLNNDRLDIGENKEADKGFKVKKTGLTISFSVEANKVVEITTGSLSGASISVDGAAAAPMTASHTHTYYSANAQAFLITMTAGDNKYNIFKSINIRDPYQVTLDAETNGGEAVGPMYGTLSVILPSATKGTDHFIGWYEAADGDALVGLAGAEYTPTADVTLYAHFAAQSNDTRLGSWQIDGADVEVPTEVGNLIHRIHLPYGTPVADLPKITAAEAYDTYAQGAEISPAAGPEWREDVEGGCYVQQVIVTAEDGSKGYYHVRTFIDPKDMLCIIKAEHDGTATGATVTGFYGGEYDKNTATNGKLGVKNQYLGIKLAEEAGTFKAGDVLKIYAPTPSAKVRIYSDKGTTRINATDGIFDSEKMFTYTLTGDEEWIYLYRRTDGESDMNPTLGYMAVYRPVSKPLVETITFNGAEATVDNTLKTITVEVPASTTLATMPVVATFLSNDPSQTSGAVTGGTWAEGINEYIVTDKDNDQTVYTVTITKAVPSSDATLSALSYGDPAKTIALADGVFEYNVTLPYGTSAVPALAATKNHAGATIESIDNATAFVDRKATSTVTVKAEDNATTQDYIVNFTVDRYETTVLWDGSTMDELSDITAMDVATADISVDSKNASFEGKNYTKALSFGGNTKNTRYFGIVVPEGKVAKVSIVYRSRGNTARSIIIGTAIASAIDESAIVYATKENDTELLYKLTADIFAAGTIYINTTNGFQVFEIDVQLADGYARSAMLGAGVLGTVCVPNNVAVEDIQGVTVYELMGRDYTNYGKLAFDEIVSGELEAGVPYLFQAHGNHMAMLYGEDHEANPVNKGNGMYGTFEQTVLSGDQLDGVYYFAQKALWSCEGALDLTIGANRAYVKLSEIPELNANQMNPAPGRRRVTMAVNGEKVATGMENVQGDDVQSTKMLINGQLFILRGEKMYDATGRLVK